MVRSKIIEIDMHYRDGRVLLWMSGRIEDGYEKITFEEIAKEFQCTYVTARNIVIRLRLAGLIVAEKESNTSGYKYKIPKVAA